MEDRGSKIALSSITTSIFYLLSSILILSTSGCNLIGVAARAFPPEQIKPKYTGLAGQSIGVMVWTDRGIQVDFPSLARDLANSIQTKLASDKHSQLAKAQFPFPPTSIIRYQQDHPNLDMSNVADVAPRLGVARLIYIEVEEFGTRAAASIDLFRGSMTVTLKVVEVTNGVGKVVYEENNVKAVFPEKVPDDGTPRGDDYQFYLGTIDAMSTQVLWRLVPHEAPED